MFFHVSKWVLASIHVPNGEKGGQGSVCGLSVSSSITIQPTTTNWNGNNALNYQKQRTLKKEIYLTKTNS